MTRCVQFYTKVKQLYDACDNGKQLVAEWCEKDVSTVNRILTHMDFCDDHDIPLSAVPEAATRRLRKLKKKQPEVVEQAARKIRNVHALTDTRLTTKEVNYFIDEVAGETLETEIKKKPKHRDFIFYCRRCHRNHGFDIFDAFPSDTLAGQRIIAVGPCGRYIEFREVVK